MRIWYAIADCGDGSSVVLFFKEEPSQALLDEEEYYANEGVARSFEADNVSGIRFCDPNTGCHLST